MDDRMVLPEAAAWSLFVGSTLVILVAGILIQGRRKPPGVLLAVFLGLIAANFLAGAAAVLTGDPRWAVVAGAALALDPFYLLYFATAYPYVRRPPRIRLLLGIVAAWAAVSTLLVLVSPDRTLRALGSPPRTAARLVLIGELAFAYAAAWLVTLRSAREAPTDGLARRARWMVLAVGVAVVPRLSLVYDDFQLGQVTGWGQPGSSLPSVAALAAEAAEAIIVHVAVMAAVLLVGYLWASRPEPRDDEVDRTIARTGWLVAAVTALSIVPPILGLGSSTLRFGARWLVFAGILAAGILQHEIVDLEGATERFVPAVGASVGIVAGALGTLRWTTSQGVGSGIMWPLAVGVGLAAAWPAGKLTQFAVRRVEWSPGPAGGRDRRLEMYRAALEVAWAQGPPDEAERRELEDERRTLGLSVAEARTLQHVVASETSKRPPGLAPGDEPAPGLVVEEQLAEGGQSRVYAARRHSEGDRVVLKVLDAETPKAAREQLRKEAAALEGLDHPHVVDLLDVRLVDGRHILVFERIEGKTLRQRLDEGPLDDREIRRIALGLLEGLEALHDRGVVHRDVKPENVLLADDGRAVLTDLGVATPMPETAELGTVTAFTDLGGLQGTLPYMAPEQVRTGRSTAASDLYAVGLVLYEALTGRRALRVEGETLLKAIESISDPHVDLDVVPEAWRGVLERALAEDPDDRFVSAGEMRAAVPDGWE